MDSIKMKKIKTKFKLNYDWFVPWILDSYDTYELIEAWGGGLSIEDHAIGVAGMFPIQHIENWEEVRSFYDKPFSIEDREILDCANKYETWLEYYEEDGYVQHIPTGMEVEWVYGKDFIRVDYENN